MRPQGPHFSAHSTAKTNDKSTNLRNGISDVVTASVYFGENLSDEVDDNDYE